jgi:hypothetical protein
LSGRTTDSAAGMVKRYHGSFPSFSYEFDSRYPLHSLYLVVSALNCERRSVESV